MLRLVATPPFVRPSVRPPARSPRGPALQGTARSHPCRKQLTRLLSEASPDTGLEETCPGSLPGPPAGLGHEQGAGDYRGPPGRGLAASPRRTPCTRERLARGRRSGRPNEWVDESGRRSPSPVRPPAPPPALPGPPHPSPGTSRSFSPRACSWLAKLTNSSSPPPDSGRFRRSLARARRAARSSRLRSASAFRPPLPGRLLAACFRDMASAPRPAAAGGAAAGPRGGSAGARRGTRSGRRGHRVCADARHPGHVAGPRPLRAGGGSAP